MATQGRREPIYRGRQRHAKHNQTITRFDLHPTTRAAAKKDRAPCSFQRVLLLQFSDVVVLRRTNRRFLLGRAKVCDLDTSVVCQQQVGAFQVAMRDAHCMQILHAAQRLMDIRAGRGLVEWAELLQQSVQVKRKRQ
jgi:hypothetical protein